MVEFLTVLARRWRIIVAFVVLGVGSAALITEQLTPVYRAETQLFVALAAYDGSPDSLAQGELFSVNRVRSYPKIVNSPLVLEPVIEQLDLDMTVDELAGKVSAEAAPQTVLIDVTVDDPSADRAASIANAVAAQFVTVVEDLDRTETSGNSPVRVSIVRPATPPADPRFPIPPLNLVVGLAAGLALGLAAAALREALDTSIKNESDVLEATGLATLGAVPVNNKIQDQPVVTHGSKHPIWGESYRKLRTNISYLDPDHPPRVLLVTSALPGEGKTVTAANLAASLAQSGKSTILIEADLRRPSVDRLLSLEPEVGITNVIAGKAAIAEVVQHHEGFDVITSGPIPPNPSELLGSQAFKGLVATLLESYDTVVIDTPPVIAVTDAAVAAVVADVAIVVCLAGRTKKPELRRALEGLQAVDAHVAGVVLNQVVISSGEYYQYRYDSHSRTHSKKS